MIKENNLSKSIHFLQKKQPRDQAQIHANKIKHTHKIMHIIKYNSVLV